MARQLRDERPGIGVVLLSQHADVDVRAARCSRAASAGRAYLLKERVADVGELTAAIRAVADGGSVIDPTVVEQLVAREPGPRARALDPLTPRELEVLGEMAKGGSNATIAGALFLSERAIEKHTNSIFAKLGLSEERDLNRRVAAVLVYLSEHGRVASHTPTARSHPRRPARAADGQTRCASRPTSRVLVVDDQRPFRVAAAAVLRARRASSSSARQPPARRRVEQVAGAGTGPRADGRAHAGIDGVAATRAITALARRPVVFRARPTTSPTCRRRRRRPVARPTSSKAELAAELLARLWDESQPSTDGHAASRLSATPPAARGRRQPSRTRAGSTATTTASSSAPGTTTRHSHQARPVAGDPDARGGLGPGDPAQREPERHAEHQRRRRRGRRPSRPAPAATWRGVKPSARRTARSRAAAALVSDQRVRERRDASSARKPSSTEGQRPEAEQVAHLPRAARAATSPARRDRSRAQRLRVDAGRTVTSAGPRRRPRRTAAQVAAASSTTPPEPLVAHVRTRRRRPTTRTAARDRVRRRATTAC